MELHSIACGNFKLDGGAMFGVVPKTLWEKTNPADSNNRIEMCSRSLLVEEGDRLILIDTGMGNKQNEKFFSHYDRWGDENLDQSLLQKGFHRDDITDVFFTHLHFDHCGDAVIKVGESSYDTTFKNANYWSNKAHWEWAIKPNKREVASFLKENILPIEESGQLSFLEKNSNDYLTETELGFQVLFVDGHTEKQMIPLINYKGKKIAFAADLVPTAGHIPLPYIPGYDIRPLTSLKEKDMFLNFCNDNNVFLFFEHDASEELGLVHETERGIRLKETLKIIEL